MDDAAEPESPQAAAAAWVDNVLGRRDLAAAWPATDPQLRLVLAQDWVWNHRHDPAIGHDQDWDEIANGLAAGPGAHPLWGRFAAELLGTWERTWRGFGTDAWTVKDEPEVLDLDLELVTFVEAETALTRRFVLRHTENRWLVASVSGDQLFEPGWPPRQGRPAGQA
ncbi:MAG: hypothetical protein ACRD2W_11735 [Acidimicrobiales bacterium]